MTTGSYTFSITLTTQDPAFANLCQTYNQLRWSVSGSSVDSAAGTIQAKAWNPTAFNTHWYVSSAYYNPGPSFDVNSAWVGGYAKYFNYDFLKPDVATYVEHWDNLWGYPDGSTRYSYRYTYSGEASSLLHTLVGTGP